MPRSLHPVLFSIADDSPTRTKDIARTLGILPSTASRYVAALVDIGYVRREADPDDGRAAFLVLTPAGSAAHKALVDTWTAILWEGSASRPEVDPAGLAEAFATFIDGVREISAPRSKNAEAGTVARNPPALRGARRDS
jgi:DNA-binding MarR family transcriptional regulator